MDHQTYRTLADKNGEETVQLCQWCLQWKPESKMKGALFLKRKICYNCYYNVWSVVRENEVMEALMTWLKRHMAKNSAEISAS